MKSKSIIAAAILLVPAFSSCHFSPKETIHDTGDKVGQSVGEFVHGVSGGVGKAFTLKLDLSDDLKSSGLSTGKIIMHDTLNKTNMVSIYFIFGKNFDDDITVKVFDNKGLEMGRSKVALRGKKGDARFYDFKFDQRTDIESDCKLVAE